jgi:hypothetical protein
VSNYPDAPGARMAYDTDGSQMFLVQYSGITSRLSQVNTAQINDEADTEVQHTPDGTGNAYLFVVFPELRDLAGFYVDCRRPFPSYVSVVDIATSANSTTGLDGTWVAYPSPVVQAGLQTNPNYRLLIQPLNRPGTKMFRVTISTGQPNALGEVWWRAVHLYGKKTAESGNALSLWHPSSNQPLTDFPTYLDWGDRPRGGAVLTKTVRVKNVSSALTAQGVKVSASALTDAAAPSLVDQYAFATGGGYQTLLDIGDLAPGAVSGVITIRLTLDIATQLGLWTQRVLAVPTAWA